LKERSFAKDKEEEESSSALDCDGSAQAKGVGKKEGWSSENCARSKPHYCRHHSQSISARRVAGYEGLTWVSIALVLLGRITTYEVTPTQGIVVRPSKHMPELHLHEQHQPRNPQRADIIPTEGFAMVVDGQLKSKFNDEQDARAAGAELLSKFPMLRVEVYNAQTRVRTKVEAVS
jgi:hypothetical protein